MLIALHPLRQPAPQVVAVAEPMPATAPMMEAMTGAPPSARRIRLRPQQRRCRATCARGAGLFADAAARRSSRQLERQPVAAEPPRPSLFSTVTGAFRRRLPTRRRAAPSRAPVRAEPAMQQDAAAEQPRASVRQTAGDEVGLDIPAFLRRQSS